MIFRLFLVTFWIIIFSSSWSQAQETQKKKKAKAQIAIVQVEGAAVYQFPNFDAPVLEYVRSGVKVIASLKPREGIGGFGAFYRVRLPNKKLGWMADVDLLPQFKADSKRKSKKEANPDFEKAKHEAEEEKRDPIYFEKYIGGGVGLVQYAEKFEGRTLSSDSTVLGLRMVGPGVLFDGPPLDFSLLVSLEAPSYYQDFANGPASGFFLLSDFLMTFPMMDSSNKMLTLGFGPMLTYTNFKVQIRSSTFDSQELRLGVVADLGYMHRFSDFAIKLDGKYYYEKTDYYGFLLSFLVHTR